MPRNIPRLARLSLTPPTYTSTPSTISAVRSILSTSLPISRALPSIPTSSRLLQPRTLSQSSIFASSPRSTILSRLPIPLFQAHQTHIRTLTYGTTYQPSQRKRKRKYGFLARLKGGRLGQAILARRRIRGRRFLSH